MGRNRNTVRHVRLATYQKNYQVASLNVVDRLVMRNIATKRKTNYESSYIEVANTLRLFLRISQLLERILLEHIDMKNSLYFKLQIYYLCSLEFRLENKMSFRKRAA